MTHNVRDVKRAGPHLSGIKVPSLVGIGIVGYNQTPQGRKGIITVWPAKAGDEVKNRYGNNWYASKKKALKDKWDFAVSAAVKLGSKKTELIEIQITGGVTKDKIAFA
jgi:ribosomal protein L3